MPETQKQNLIADVQKSSKFFECEVTIRVFGVEILHFVFPPKKS